MTISVHAAVARQTGILLGNLRALVELAPSVDSVVGEWGFREQLFHALTSLDKWFVDPGSEFARSVDALRRERSRMEPDELAQYWAGVEERIRRYLAGSPDWESCPEDCRWSRLELAMAQERHAMHHVGYLHAWLRERGVEPPAWMGLD